MRVTRALAIQRAYTMHHHPFAWSFRYGFSRVRLISRVDVACDALLPFGCPSWGGPYFLSTRPPYALTGCEKSFLRSNIRWLYLKRSCFRAVDDFCSVLQTFLCKLRSQFNNARSRIRSNFVAIHVAKRANAKLRILRFDVYFWTNSRHDRRYVYRMPTPMLSHFGKNANV